MEPILDETSLVPCAKIPTATRISELADTLRALDALGARRMLRSTQDAANRDIGAGRGLRQWCFDRSINRDAGLLIAGRLSAQPFIDGADGLFAVAEAGRAVEAMFAGAVVMGAGLAALIDGVLVALIGDAREGVTPLPVDLRFLDTDGERREAVQVAALASGASVESARTEIIERVDRSVQSGESLVQRLTELFPSVMLGQKAHAQLSSLTGNEIVFRQVLRHLRALDAGARNWPEGQPFAPVAVSHSAESKATLDHGTYGPMRDFPTPAGFAHERWSNHTKLTGGNGARLYFRGVRMTDRTVVLVGYFGDHLPTVLHPG